MGGEDISEGKRCHGRERTRGAHGGERKGREKKKRDVVREGEAISLSRTMKRGEHKREREGEMRERKGDRGAIRRLSSLV